MTTTLEQAVTAARKACPFVNQDAVLRILTAAAPLIAAAERSRLANRSQMIDEVKNELDDAFQFTNLDGSRHGYVTREWVQALLAIHAASAGAAQQEADAQLANQHQAMAWDKPGHGWTSAQPGVVRVPFADLLRNPPERTP
jgi:hypothetical protein